MTYSEIIPIISSQVDFKSLTATLRKALNRSVTKGLDNRSEDFGPYSSLLCILDEFVGNKSDPYTSVKNAGHLLSHLHFGFLFVCFEKTAYEMISRSNLNVTIMDSIYSGLVVGIISGNLVEWREALINLTTGKETLEIRQIMEKVIIWLDRWGLGSMVRKEALQDNSIKLLPNN